MLFSGLIFIFFPNFPLKIYNSIRIIFAKTSTNIRVGYRFGPNVVGPLWPIRVVGIFISIAGLLDIFQVINIIWIK